MNSKGAKIESRINFGCNNNKLRVKLDEKTD